MKTMSTATAALALCTGALFAATVPAAADTAMAAASAPPIDCSHAASTIHSMSMPAGQMMMSASPAPGDATITVDAGYTQLMLATLEHIDQMAKIEMACGKNAAMKAHAKSDAEMAEREMESFIHIPAY